MVVENCWVYILFVSSKVFLSESVLRQLRWIEAAKGRVRMMFLYFDVESDLVRLFPKSLFTSEQLKTISSLSSFCISDSTWMEQVLYSLNWMRKAALLDNHIAILSKRAADKQLSLDAGQGDCSLSPPTLNFRSQVSVY